MLAGGRLASVLHHLSLSTNSSKEARKMSTGSGVPRWQSVVEHALEEDKNAHVFQLATIDNVTASATALPHVRSLGHRAFLSRCSPASPILLSTTDARTDKIEHISQNPRVEIAWWLPQPKEQLRISGIAYVYPAPDFSLSPGEAAGVPEEKKRQIEDAVAKLSKSFPGKELGGDGFDWEEARRTWYDRMSEFLRASWVRPIPGSRLVSSNATEELPQTLPKLGEAGDKKPLVEAALKNFALVLIDPLEVDYLELGVVPNRRTRFFKEGDQWKEESLVP